MRRPSWLLIAFLAVGLLLVYGGWSTFRDQRSGTPGQARVTSCEGGRQYDPGIRCRGTWTTGGSLTEGGRVIVGRVEGAGYGDVGRTIDVRVHGDDHATVPSLGTPITLWALGGPIALLSLWAIWRTSFSAART